MVRAASPDRWYRTRTSRLSQLGQALLVLCISTFVRPQGRTRAASPTSTSSEPDQYRIASQSSPWKSWPTGQVFSFGRLPLVPLTPSCLPLGNRDRGRRSWLPSLPTTRAPWPWSGTACNAIGVNRRQRLRSLAGVLLVLLGLTLLIERLLDFLEAVLWHDLSSFHPLLYWESD